MNAIVLHLMVNDVPFIGLVFATALFAYACFKNRKDFEKYSLWMFVVLMGIAGVALVTSPAVEEIIGEALGRGENNLIEVYQQAAIVSFSSILVLGGTTLTGFYVYRRRERLPREYLGAIFVMALLATVLSGWAADREGRLHHAELIAVARLMAITDTQSSVAPEPLDSLDRGY